MNLPSTCRLGIHVTTHADWRFVFSGTWAYGEDVSHLVDFDLASQTLAFTDQPVSRSFVRRG